MDTLGTILIVSLGVATGIVIYAYGRMMYYAGQIDAFRQITERLKESFLRMKSIQNKN